MIVKTHEEYCKEQERQKKLHSSYMCPACYSNNTEITMLRLVYHRPKESFLGKIGLAYDTIRTPEFECKECHTVFTVESLDEVIA